MKNIEICVAGLKRIRAWEPPLRFVFGGVVTLLTGVIANAYGPVIAGLFLSFPAILPASLTLVARHQGRVAAADDAKGATIASLGLGAFGIVVWLLAARIAAPLTLVAALAAWSGISLAAWCLVFARRGRDFVAKGSADPELRPSALDAIAKRIARRRPVGGSDEGWPMLRACSRGIESDR